MTKPGRITKLDRKILAPLLFLIAFSVFIYFLISTNSRLNENSEKLFQQLEGFSNQVEDIPGNQSSRKFYLILHLLENMGISRCDSLLPDPECKNPDLNWFVREEHHSYDKKTKIIISGTKVPHHNLKSLVLRFPSSYADRNNRITGITVFTNKNGNRELVNLLTLLKRKCSPVMFDQWIFVENEEVAEYYKKAHRDHFYSNTQSTILLSKDSAGYNKEEIKYFLSEITKPDGLNEIDKKRLWCE